MYNIEYKVNKEKKTVTAIMSDVSEKALEAVNRMGYEQSFLYADGMGTSLLIIPDKLIATVHCAKEDVFDEDVGKKLAKKKVLRKFDRERSKVWYDYKKYLQRNMDAVNRCIKKYPSDYKPPVTRQDMYK